MIGHWLPSVMLPPNAFLEDSSLERSGIRCRNLGCVCPHNWRTPVHPFPSRFSTICGCFHATLASQCSVFTSMTSNIKEAIVLKQRCIRNSSSNQRKLLKHEVYEARIMMIIRRFSTKHFDVFDALSFIYISICMSNQYTDDLAIPYRYFL